MPNIINMINLAKIYTDMNNEYHFKHSTFGIIILCIDISSVFFKYQELESNNKSINQSIYNL